MIAQAFNVFTFGLTEAFLPTVRVAASGNVFVISFTGHRPHFPPEVSLPPWKQPLVQQVQAAFARVHSAALRWPCHLPGELAGARSSWRNNPSWGQAVGVLMDQICAQSSPLVTAHPHIRLSEERRLLLREATKLPLGKSKIGIALSDTTASEPWKCRKALAARKKKKK